MSLMLCTVLFCQTGLPSDGQKTGPYPRTDLLVEVAELAQPEAAKRFRILDARDKQQYLVGHIPGAIRVDLVVWSRAELGAQHHDAWARRIGVLGIANDTPVVVYDDNANKDAARIWWILRYWGIRDVRLLNGGWRAWQSNGGNASADEEKPPVRNPHLGAEQARLATKDQVLEALTQKETQIVDARSRGEYCGAEKTAKRNGAIPGATHIEWLEVLDGKSQRFKSAAELSELFKKRGITLAHPAITYCQSGGRAAVMAFALELMGAKQVRTYYKSWKEWGNSDDTPVMQPEN